MKMGHPRFCDILLAMSNVQPEKDAVEVTEFGRMADGSAVHLYTVRCGRASVSFSDFGARIVAVMVPDDAGDLANVVQGFETLELYLADTSYQGAIVGRFGNRIAGGRFSLDGKSFEVPQNDGDNALHGGPEGFDRRLWAGKTIEDGVEFKLVSPDGDQGFPGSLEVVVRYTFTGSALRIEYAAATCDAATVVNVTNHAYFNLSGESCETILDHLVRIPAERYTPVTENLVPTGELAPVAGTPFDFCDWKRIGDADEQLKRAGGYDHNWVFGDAGKLKTVAHVSASGRLLTVETTEPGLQFYSGNFLDGSMPNRSGGRYERRSGLCLETQHYPDSPNHPDFPTTTLKPGETMRSTTVYTFSVNMQARHG